MKVLLWAVKDEGRLKITLSVFNITASVLLPSFWIFRVFLYLCYGFWFFLSKSALALVQLGILTKTVFIDCTSQVYLNLHFLYLRCQLSPVIAVFMELFIEGFKLLKLSEISVHSLFPSSYFITQLIHKTKGLNLFLNGWHNLWPSLFFSCNLNIFYTKWCWVYFL